jgi:hypothetical protein
MLRDSLGPYKFDSSALSFAKMQAIHIKTIHLLVEYFYMDDSSNSRTCHFRISSLLLRSDFALLSFSLHEPRSPHTLVRS